MKLESLEFLSTLAWILSFLFTSYALYYLIFALVGIKHSKPIPKFAPKHKLAVVIAARNEAPVIGNLIESLMQQNYPRDLYDIYVVPNNCTDQTKEVAEAAGAFTFSCPLPVKSKGDALTQVFDYLMQHHTYNAFCVFDADNLVHADFLEEMNNALCAGAKLAQGYRDSKNPYDTPISGCYSIYYWMVNRLYNNSRSQLGLSALINGSGFMVRADLLAEMGGWHTYTMTEDIEFTAQNVLRGNQVTWVPRAIIYDEQPLTFAQSWKQRKRWSTGQIQGFQRYGMPLLRRLFQKQDIRCLDQFIFFLAPAMQAVYLASLVTGFLLDLLMLNYHFFPRTDLYYQMFVSFNVSYLLSIAMCIFTLLLERKANRKITKSVLYYWIFIASWIPINILCMFKKTTVWHEIKHTRSVRLSELNSR